MRQAVGNRTDPWERAMAIEDWVFRNMRRKNFGTSFATAHEVARELEGDCTEHGVLAAAMCRAAGIPSRVAVGLVYAAHLKGFGFHLWNEVYVNGRWVALDATFNQSAVDATHVKIADSSLDGVAPFEVLLPVARYVDKITIEPEEIR
jgi:transglutaminase-like putative cysteine protease